MHLKASGLALRAVHMQMYIAFPFLLVRLIVSRSEACMGLSDPRFDVCKKISVDVGRSHQTEDIGCRNV